MPKVKFQSTFTADVLNSIHAYNTFCDYLQRILQKEGVANYTAILRMNSPEFCKRSWGCQTYWWSLRPSTGMEFDVTLKAFQGTTWFRKLRF